MASQVDLYCQIGRERLLSQDWQNREFATKAPSRTGIHFPRAI